MTPANFPAAAIVLAAGEAKRMGSPKQLLPYRGGTLLSHVVQTVQTAGFHPVIVVVGANEEAVRGALPAGTEVADNRAWALGMGSSIQAGIKHLLESCSSLPDAVAIVLADQPLVGPDDLIRLRAGLAAAATDAAAAEYAGDIGVPAIFRTSVIPLLRTLPADSGAQALFRQGKVSVTPVTLESAAVDIDTPDDFATLKLRGGP